MFTVDTSVWINGASPTEAGHADSRAFLDHVLRLRVPLVLPTLLQVEVAGVVGDTRRDPVLAMDLANEIASLPAVRWVNLDGVIATTLAARQALRGADAVYAAVAQEYGCDLVSLDTEHLTRLTGVCRTLTPAAALALLLPVP